MVSIDRFYGLICPLFYKMCVIVITVRFVKHTGVIMPKQKTSLVSYTFRIDLEVLEQFKQYSKENDVTVSVLLNEAAEKYAKTLEYRVAESILRKMIENQDKIQSFLSPDLVESYKNLEKRANLELSQIKEISELFSKSELFSNWANSTQSNQEIN